MLFNLTQDTCVSKHSSSHIDHWIFYHPSETAENKKRITWQKDSGLLTTQEMQNFLMNKYPNSNHAFQFMNIAQKLQSN